MYQTDFICTYKMMPDERSQEQLYSIQLLQALGLDQWDDIAADLVLDTTLTQVQSEPIFRYILSLAKANKNIADMTKLFYVTEPSSDNDKSIVLRLLFSYDYFDMMHRCVSDMLRDNIVKEKHYVALCHALTSDQVNDHVLTYTAFCASLD